MKYKYIPVFILTIIGISAIIYAESTTESDSLKTETILLASEDSAHDDFNIMMDVVTHKRCMNCHPSGDRPRQGEDGHLHYFNVQRGPDNHGIGSLKCVTCHRDSNNMTAGIPGAPHWHLAPKSMAWEGLSRIEIASAILDKEKNGNRSLEEIIKHMTEDPLVLWVFDPGVNNEGMPRQKPPVSKEEYITSVKNWAKAGAIIPEN